LTGETVDAATLALGRRVFNARCYFCHGYGGNAKTIAAAFLAPPPRDFTRAVDLARARILRSIRDGRPGTAMKPFGALLSDTESAAVATFIEHTFIRGRGPNTRYHTAANGWPEHERRYGGAYPFALGQIPLDVTEMELSAAERRGLALFRGSCATCHVEGADVASQAPLRLAIAPPPRSAVASENGAARARGADGDTVKRSVRHRESDAEARDDGHGYGYGYQGHDDEEYGSGPNDMEHATPPPLVAPTPAEAAGAELYRENCAFCHAGDGTGKNWIGRFLQPHPPDFTDPAVATRLTARTLPDVIRKGLVNTSMPAFAAVLDETKIAALVAYLRRAFPPTAKPRL